MDSFEQAFSDTERAATATLTSANELVRQAKQLQKVAKEGNIAAIKRTQVRLDTALADLRQRVANSVQSWPFQDEEEEEYLREGYNAELIRVAGEQGLEIYERDGRLICHPSIVRILTGEQAVRIDKKQTSTIRPSHLVSLLVKEQKKPARFQSAQFLESLYRVYSVIAREESSDRMIRAGRVIPLTIIYQMFTAKPGETREYTPTDFARSLYQLDSGDIKTTRSGATVSFPASTGARSARGVFTFVGPDGRDVSYYSIRFTQAE